jgi:carbonic anhydrase
MDTRLTDGFLEQAMGMKRGDAKIIKNAGNVIGVDMIRSVAASIFSLGVEEVILIGHLDCGMANVRIEKLKKVMEERGIASEDLAKIDLKEWIGAIGSERSNVVEGVKRLKNSPFIPDDVPVHGLTINIVTGSIDVVVNGYK